MLSVYLIFKDIASVLLAFWIEDKFEIQKFFIVHFFFIILITIFQHYHPCNFFECSILLSSISMFIHVIMYINNWFYFTEDWKVRYPCEIELMKEHCLLISVPLNFSCILNRYLPKMWLIIGMLSGKKNHF